MDGVFQIASVDPSARIIRARSSGFTGTHDGSRVTITFRDPPSGVATVAGLLGWRSLRLDIPQGDGQVQAVRLGAGDASDYNRAALAVKKAHPGLEIQGS